MSGIKRLIEPKQLPSSLWDAENEILHISPSLALAYETIIDRHGLRELGKTRDPKDAPIGGESRERSDQHFAQQFDGSVARVQLALTDPKDAVPAVCQRHIRFRVPRKILEASSRAQRRAESVHYCGQPPPNADAEVVPGDIASNSMPYGLVDADPRVQGTELVATRTGELICDRKGEHARPRTGPC